MGKKKEAKCGCLSGDRGASFLQPQKKGGRGDGHTMGSVWSNVGGDDAADDVADADGRFPRRGVNLLHPGGIARSNAF